MEKLLDKYQEPIYIGDTVVFSYRTHDDKLTVEKGIISEIEVDFISVDCGWSVYTCGDTYEVPFHIDLNLQDVMKVDG